MPGLVHKSETRLRNAAYLDPQLNWKRDSSLRPRNLQVGSVSKSVIEYIQKRLIAPGAIGRREKEDRNFGCLLASFTRLGGEIGMLIGSVGSNEVKIFREKEGKTSKYIKILQKGIYL